MMYTEKYGKLTIFTRTHLSNKTNNILRMAADLTKIKTNVRRKLTE